VDVESQQWTVEAFRRRRFSPPTMGWLPAVADHYPGDHLNCSAHSQMGNHGPRASRFAKLRSSLGVAMAFRRALCPMVEVESTNHIGKPWPKLSQAAGRSLMLQMRQPRGMNIRLLGLRRAINDLLTVVDHARSDGLVTSVC
jgi:hypothetical protein